jgi:hypothetical protein
MRTTTQYPWNECSWSADAQRYVTFYSSTYINYYWGHKQVRKGTPALFSSHITLLNDNRPSTTPRPPPASPTTSRHGQNGNDVPKHTPHHEKQPERVETQWTRQDTQERGTERARGKAYNGFLSFTHYIIHRHTTRRCSCHVEHLWCGQASSADGHWHLHPAAAPISSTFPSCLPVLPVIHQDSEPITGPATRPSRPSDTKWHCR